MQKIACRYLYSLAEMRTEQIMPEKISFSYWEGEKPKSLKLKLKLKKRKIILKKKRNQKKNTRWINKYLPLGGFEPPTCRTQLLRLNHYATTAECFALERSLLSERKRRKKLKFKI